MSLSLLLKQYIYIPLGGNRFGFPRQMLALFITMLACGIWHGAGWTFIWWGLMHGFGLIVNNVWSKVGYKLPAWLGWCLTMLFVIIGWVLFRSPDIATFKSLMASLLGLNGITITNVVKLNFLLMSAFVFAAVGPTSQQIVNIFLKPKKVIAVLMAVILVAVVLEVGKGNESEFIYFQF